MYFSKQPAKFSMLILSALLLLCYGVGNAHCSTVHENITDLHALLDFKQGVTSDPNEALRSWNTNIHFCSWKYVSCTQARPWRVSGLNLSGQNLEGKVSSSFANLTLLSMVDLSLNRFFGELPPLSALQQLDTLYLNGNTLEGNIPDALTNCSKLRELDLSNNQLSGPIPTKIGSLSYLHVLVLDNNNLTGIIPPTFSNLTHLSFCSMVENQLEGTIPHGIWQSSNMTVLQLGNNRLSGEIPQQINMSRLQVLGLEFNKLGKALPSSIGHDLPNLRQVGMGGNMFQGRIPASLGNASRLNVIDLSVNSFTGPVPASLGKLSSLEWLNLDKNKLETRDRQSWEFVNGLRNCSSLTLLSLYDNQLQGNLPDSVGNLSTTLQYLSFGRNELTGIVPQSIGNFHDLIRLGLEQNNLSGAIEEWIGKLKQLQGLFLSGNNFKGPIPSSISYLTQLTLLFLDSNEFNGLIPLGIENLSQLSVLSISYNNLQGSIPLGVGSLRQLVELHLSSNKLTGEIPDALGQCQNLVVIEMGHNNLSGGIPESFGNLKSLNILNLSDNMLAGTIPTVLDNLNILSKLDLSHNHLQGEIPRNGVFGNASEVSLDGNWGLCGGAAELNMPQCYAVSKKKEWKRNLFILLISIIGFMSLIMLVNIIFHQKKASRKPYLLLFSFGKQFPKVSYKDIAQATCHTPFSEVLEYTVSVPGSVADTAILTDWHFREHTFIYYRSSLQAF